MNLRPLRSLLVLVVALLSFPAMAQYPNKPIRLLVPYPAGGGGDAIARIVSQQMAATLGANFVLDFKPGADTQIASSELTRAAPDGYTLMIGNAAGLSYVPAIRKVQPYDAVRDFTPISLLLNTTFAFFVHPGVPVKSMQELVAYARANPGKISYGTPTASAVLLAAVFAKDNKIDMVHIPYKGDAQAVTELLSGRIDLVVGAPGAYQQHVKEGKLRALAVTSSVRSSKMPDVPTFAEAGFPPMKVKSWNGLIGPANMPKDVVDQLSRAAQTAVAREDVRTQLETLGFVAQGSSPEELAALIKDQLGVWKGAVAQAGLVAE